MQLEVDDPDQGNFSIDPTMATRHTIKKEKTKNKSIICTHLFEKSQYVFHEIKIKSFWFTV